MKIKVMEVSSDSNIGGAGRCLIALLKNFDYEQFDVSVVLPPNSLLKPEIEALGIKVFEVCGIAEKSLDLKSIKRLTKLFKRESPDIVHTHASMSARIAAHRTKAVTIYTRHSVFPPSKKLTTFPGKAINGFINNRYADGIIAVAEAAKDNLTDTGVDPNRIEVILNGVDGLSPISDEEKAEVRARFGVKPDEKVVSNVARLEDIKGHKYFIEAAKQLIDKGINAKFLIAGTGSYEAELKSYAKELGVTENVIFTGFISDVDKLMNITDVQVNASYGTEATSLALLEGMSLGIPAVVSDFGGNPGVIKNGSNGIVFPKKNSDELARGVEKLLCDKETYDKMSQTAKAIFNERFTSRIMTKNTENMYLKTLRRSKKK